MHALVIGGSMSGLFAGLLLRRAGISAEIYERVEAELTGRGAGIVTQPEMRAVLVDAGCDLRDLGVDIASPPYARPHRPASSAHTPARRR